MIKVCKLCGREFEGRKNSSYCDGPHFRKCEVCGREFQLKRDVSSDKRVVCSEECRHIRRLRIESAKGKFTKHCIICGEEFHTDTQDRVICNKHTTATCSVCGKEFKLYSYNRVTVTCDDPKCLEEAKSRKMFEERGVRHIFQDTEFQNKARQSMVERYGVPYTMQSEELKEKFRQLHKDKYGVSWPMQREDVREKSRQTLLEKYGVENIFCTGPSRDNIIQTWISMYGVDNPFKSEEIKEKIKETCLERYGYEFAHSSPSVRDQTSKTRIQMFADNLQEPYRSEYLKFKSDPRAYVEAAISENENADAYTLAHRVGHTDPTTMIEFFEDCGLTSNRGRMTVMEAQIYDLIHHIDSSISIKIHDRTTLGDRKEMDLYLPDYKIGIECNPTATHNSTLSYSEIIHAEFHNEPTAIDYHQKKSKLAENEGIFLFNVFGYEWSLRPAVIDSMIRNLLGKNLYKFYARKLHIKEISYSEASVFLNNNHRQGGAMSKVNIGLFTDDEELVSLMTFGHTRPTIGKQNQDDSNIWELIRFCNKINTSVVGGASKLFKYFLGKYSPDKVLSFSDVAHTRGKLYETLGFTKIHTSSPNYVWVHVSTDLCFNRVACQKRNLPKLFNEPDLDIKNQTEEQIMVKHGFVQVFDSGTIRWEYENK